MKVINLAKIDFAGGGSAPVPPVPPGPTPTPSAPPKDVNFRDYDGSIVASYTKAEFAALTAMPANPTHEGLTGQGWNWTLANAQAYVAKYGRLEVGQMYITSDGKTRVHITLSDGRLTPYLGFGIDGSAVIDWGDGSATETVTGADATVLVQTPHTYASGGDYIISVAPAEGTSINIFGDEDEWQCRLISGGFPEYDSPNVGYSMALKKLFIGAGITITGANTFVETGLTVTTLPQGCITVLDDTFDSCYFLQHITIPNSVTGIVDYSFNYCCALASISLPNSVTSIGNTAFRYCYGLTSVTLPDGLTSVTTEIFCECYILASIIIPDSITNIDDSSFKNCYSLVSVTIPDSVSIIDSGAFSYCGSVKEYYFMSDTPPSIVADVFDGHSSDVIIYVPAASVDAYKAATNWSNLASQIKPMPE